MIRQFEENVVKVSGVNVGDDKLYRSPHFTPGLGWRTVEVRCLIGALLRSSLFGLATTVFTERRKMSSQLNFWKCIFETKIGKNFFHSFILFHKAQCRSFSRNEKGTPLLCTNQIHMCFPSISHTFVSGWLVLLIV